MRVLATIKANNIKTKFIILNNEGYLSFRNTQAKFYNGHLYGESPSTGLWFPNLEDIAKTYELEYYKITSNQELTECLSSNIHNDECAICDIKCKYLQDVIPTLSLKSGIDGSLIQCGLNDMFPFLDEEDLKKEMEF
jgi:acetolactate synthase-1/2/3 large subunit